jgi:prolipoprotein diacylglyceryltransferase
MLTTIAIAASLIAVTGIVRLIAEVCRTPKNVFTGKPLK